MAMRRVIVVGAGIVGASLAFHLAQAGARVRVIDALERAGGVATPASWAWINASWGNAEPYFRLRHASIADWRRLAGEVPGIGLSWGGGLSWDLPRADLERAAQVQAGWGYDIRLVGCEEAARIEPALIDPPDLALHVREEGSVEPVAAARALLDAARALGAELDLGSTVERLALSGERVAGVVLADGARAQADHVVLAAGAATPGLARSAGIAVPLETPPGLLAVTAPVEPCLRGLVMAPDLHVRQRPDGCLVAGADFGGSDPEGDPEGAARDLVAATARLLRTPAPLRLGGWSIGHRPTPRDGVSIAGEAADGLSLAVTHSGVTLAPVLGRLLAAEILEGHRDPLLAPFGPQRFAAPEPSRDAASA